MLRRCLLLALFIASIPLLARAGELGFLEEFALAPDREKVLEELVPGSEDAYYYRSLFLEQEGRLDDVDRLLEAWIARYKRTARVQEIEARQALLRYSGDPAATLAYLKKRLNLRFDHQRVVPGQKPNLPTRLDPKRIEPAALRRRALERHRGTLQGFEDTALATLATTKLSGELRRHLLGRLQRPDVPGLAKLVVDDLAAKGSRGFGSLGIHSRLLLEELRECARLRPQLLGSSRFVDQWLRELRPASGVDLRHDRPAREAYLERLWKFASRLPPAHNSLKACILYHRLEHDRAAGVWDLERFLAYIRLPRPAPYMRAEYLREAGGKGRDVNLSRDFSAAAALTPVRVDEPLVRSYLEHFLLGAEDTRPFDPYLDRGYLRRRLAETNLLGGRGDPEKWTAMLSPGEVKALEGRVEIEFSPANRSLFAPEDSVGLDLRIKNVSKLLVKVFEIDARSYYRAHQKEIDTAIDLDGLVAGEEKTYEYGDPPLRRIERHFEFPGLSGRGTWVVELIGNGTSSRALIRKGRLRYLERRGAAGQILTVLDSKGRKVEKPSVLLSGHLYEGDEEGDVVIPYSTSPGTRKIVLLDGDFASLESFEHRAEQYTLSAGFHVDRESLLAGEEATLLVRPSLRLGGEPIDPALLEEPKLVITSTDRDGVDTRREIAGFELHAERESTQEFVVPPELARLRFSLEGKVRSRSRGKDVPLRAEGGFSLGGIHATDRIEDLLFSRVGGAYAIDVVGKSGEAKASRPVRIQLKHRDYRDPVDVTLQSDERGRIRLGRLEGIETVSATAPEGTRHLWPTARGRVARSGALHGRAGETLRVPYAGGASEPLRSELGLLERRGGSWARDRFSALSIRGGFIELRGLEAGDYDLLLEREGRRIAVRVEAGEERLGHVLSAYRQLELPPAPPLAIAGVEAGEKELTVRIANATPLTRVHVFATRYRPEEHPFERLAVEGWPSPSVLLFPAPESQFVTGRDIGDEYRYVLERRDAKKFPGNLLARPGLLLDPWVVSSTRTSTQLARAGGAFAARPPAPAASRSAGAAQKEAAASAVAAGFTSLDFLAEPSVVLANLRPDEKGVVRVEREALGPHQEIHIVAVSPADLVYRELSLAEVASEPRDLRLRRGLDPERHYTRQRSVEVVEEGETVTVEDVSAAELEVYDTLGDVYTLFSTLTKDAALKEFRFVVDWPKLDEKTRRKEYSEHASHELSFFLYRKDPKFFREVVAPYLRNKRDKTFLDHWLLGDDLRRWLDPWAFEQLNTVEKILLGRRVAAEGPRVARLLGDRLEVLPPDADREEHVFLTALRGRALETPPALRVVASVGLEEDADGAVAMDALARGRNKPKGARRGQARAATRPGAAGGKGVGPNLRRAGRTRKKAEKAAKLAQGRANKAPVAYFPADRKALAPPRPLYRKLDETKEWAESNYWHLPVERQGADLVGVSRFWADWANHSGEGPFLSAHVAQAAGGFAEMMLALSVLDLPFEAGEHAESRKGARYTLRAASPLLVFRREVREAPLSQAPATVLVSQNWFRNGDRWRLEGGEKVEKHVEGEFVVQTVYGGHVVLTNPTSSRQKLDVLIQVPPGAIAVGGGRATRSLRTVLEPYRTWTHDDLFYFPKPGEFAGCPVQVSRGKEVIASGEPARFEVVERPKKADTTSWDYVSQLGSAEEVIGFLRERNLQGVALSRIAWRMREKAFFARALDTLRARHAYDDVLWSYGVLHRDERATREFLEHADGFLDGLGGPIESALVRLDPVERKRYQHLEYRPLVNARAHRLGRRRQILNDRFFAQYQRFLKQLSYRAPLDEGDLLAVTYYLLLQDRVEEALGVFSRVRSGRIASRLQYDYLEAYLGFFTEDLRRSRAIAARYARYPVERWRKLFASVSAQLDEIEGKASTVVNPEERTQEQTHLADTEPSLELEVEGSTVIVRYRNLERCRVSYYAMDIELLFSRSPFVGQDASRFASVRPNAAADLALDSKSNATRFELPPRFRGKNVLVRVTGGGVERSRTVFSNDLDVRVVESYGRLRVRRKATGMPLARTYVKVYARQPGGRTLFYKDGYTDLRGRFDYASLSSESAGPVERFAILVLSEEHGAVVREAAPPQS